MQVFKAISGYKQDPVRYLDFNQYKDVCGDFVFIEGAFFKKNKLLDYGVTPRKLGTRKIVRLELEEPNKYLVNDRSEKYDHLFHKVFTICPYTAEWINSKTGTRKRVPVFFPFNKTYIPKKCKKKYDVIYTGHLVSNLLYQDIQTISRFNYRLVSNSDNPLVTDKGVSYEEKIRLIAQSKITLVHNLLYPNRYYILNLWRIADFKNNRAFSLIPDRFDFIGLIKHKEFLVPQLKSRLFEAAFGRSLILCRRDPFNIIEKFFKPKKEFVYYEEGKLEETIKNLLNNFSSYEKVVERAYRKAMDNYTVDKFVVKYLKNIE